MNRVVVFRTIHPTHASANRPPRIGLLISDDGTTAVVRTVRIGRSYHRIAARIPSAHVVRDATDRERTLGYVVDPVAKLVPALIRPGAGRDVSMARKPQSRVGQRQRREEAEREAAERRARIAREETAR